MSVIIRLEPLSTNLKLSYLQLPGCPLSQCPSSLCRKICSGVIPQRCLHSSPNCVRTSVANVVVWSDEQHTYTDWRTLPPLLHYFSAPSCLYAFFVSFFLLRPARPVFSLCDHPFDVVMQCVRNSVVPKPGFIPPFVVG